jgi:hypothetical protein
MKAKGDRVLSTATPKTWSASPWSGGRSECMGVAGVISVIKNIIYAWMSRARKRLRPCAQYGVLEQVFGRHWYSDIDAPVEGLDAKDLGSNFPKKLMHPFTRTLFLA